MYPSEYAYWNDSVNRAESVSANCRRYSSLPAGPFTSNYVHCDGTQLKLADCNLGREQNSSTDYYQWTAGSDGKLLFIFPTRVSLTTITQHYYSDNLRGLPRLRFYAVPDNLDVWHAPTTSYLYVDVAAVPLGGEPACRRSVSVITNNYFNTSKVLMLKLSSSFQFALSQTVEFFTSNCTYTCTHTSECKLYISYNTLHN